MITTINIDKNKTSQKDTMAMSTMKIKEVRVGCSLTDEISSSSPSTDLVYQKIWSKMQLAQLLDKPECSKAIQRAHQRRPQNVPICPLCSRGRDRHGHKRNEDDVSPYIQYMKVPKAGSSSIISQLTGDPDQQSNASRTLCRNQFNNSIDIRFTMIRDPYDRAFSAYLQVDRNAWRQSSDVKYRSYSRTQEVPRLLQFLYDFYMGHLTAWDGGMPHHMYGAALHFDTLRTELDGNTKNNDALPDITGRLEDVEGFMTELSNILSRSQYNKTMIQEEWIMDYNNGNLDEDVEEVNLKKRNPKTYTTSKDVTYHGIEWLLEELFEEDYICFGYPFRSTLYYNDTTASIPYNELPNYQLSKSIFTNELLNNMYNRNDRPSPPTCESHYQGGLEEYAASKILVTGNQ